MCFIYRLINVFANIILVSCYTIVVVLRLIFVISKMMMDILIIMHLFGSKRETLSLDKIVLKDETTLTSESHVIDEFDSSSHCRKHR
jgi:hypothetical protein